MIVSRTVGIVFVFYLLKIYYVECRPAADNQDQTERQAAPWLNGNKFQGDIDGYDQGKFDALIDDLNKWQNRRQQIRNTSTAKHESAMSDPRGLWVDGRVPYVFASSDPELHRAVREAFDDFHSSTCVRFVPRTNEPNYLRIKDDEDGCWASLGNVHSGPQGVNLGKGCKAKGVASHELMHSIGFWHEHQRSDRDDHIIVTLENAIPQYRPFYSKAKTNEMNLIGNYDMDSVMHYPGDGFALPGKFVMKAKYSERRNFGSEQMTDEDKRKIRILYRCDGGQGDSSIEQGVKYFIKPEGTNNCLDVPGGSNQNGINLQQWDCNGTPAQQWMFTNVGGNVYSIKNVGNGKYVDIADEEQNQDGGKVQQFDSHDGGPDRWPHQQFKIEPRAGGVFHITSMLNGKIIWVDTEGKLRHWQYDAGQNWKLQRM